MSRPVTALCNNCGKITDVNYKKKRHPKEVRETYFKCEFCNKKYICFVTDKRVRKMQRKRDSLKGDYNIDKRLQIQEEINERMARLKDSMIRGVNQ